MNTTITWRARTTARAVSTLGCLTLIAGFVSAPQAARHAARSPSATPSIRLPAGNFAPANTAIADRADTVDVAVGSPLVSGDHIASFLTHIQVSSINNGTSKVVQEFNNDMTQGDSAGATYIRVESKGAAGPANTLVFERHTLRLVRTPRGEAPPEATKAFFGPWADFVAERLPHRTGTVYRVPMFTPRGPGATDVVTHLYQTMKKEDVNVFGKVVRQAWVIDDRSADGKTLLGRMWVTDGAPYLVRWEMYLPTGATTQIDQELVKPTK